MKKPGYRNYLLTLLAVILAFNYVDRTILGLALENIKADLSLSDTQLGFLTGIAFALFYAVMGIPIARWADRGNRKTIIVLTLALWSAAVALCGVAGSFIQLLLIRVAVAVGEAGCVPPAHSLIADYFNRAERPRAVARYMLGGALANVIGFLLAGWLNELYGWRAMFMLLGLPGLGLAVLGLLTLREPRQGVRTGEHSCAEPVASLPPPVSAAVSSDHPSLKEVCATLWANRTFRNLLLCFAVSAFFNSGLVQWQAVFFIRSYGLKTGELGTWFGMIYGIGGLLGLYFGGELASRFAAGNERLQLKTIAILYSGVAVFSALVYLSPNHYLAFGWMALAGVGGAAANGPLFATIQTLVPDRMRAMSIAILNLLANLVGMGLGPLATGALSDALRPLFGQDSLRYALVVLCPGYFWSAWYIWRASKTVTRDLESTDINRGLGSLRFESST
jgi:MFS transporter, Spinster family, sphingosine-1-phosphate transporter